MSMQDHTIFFYVGMKTKTSGTGENAVDKPSKHIVIEKSEEGQRNISVAFKIPTAVSIII